MIEVKNNWNWILEYVRKEIRKDKKLRDDYFKVSKKYQIKPVRIIEMYHDGIRYGINNGQYLSFKDWFYRFFESINDNHR